VYNPDLKHECGIVGIYRQPDVARSLRLALDRLQHRGQESWGAATLVGDEIAVERRMGLVDGFTDEYIARLPGTFGVGQTRYSTYGPSVLNNVQPLVFRCRYGRFALTHNGTISNGDAIAEVMMEAGHSFTTTTDTEIIGRLAGQGQNLIDGLKSAAERLRGAYALVALDSNGIYGVRDPLGFRPLCIGRTVDGKYIIASESCAFKDMGAEFYRDVEPGEIVHIGPGGEKTHTLPGTTSVHASCIFEPVYFGSPDSVIDGVPTDPFRRDLGSYLALRDDVTIDSDTIITAFPYAGNAYARGYQDGTFKRTGTHVPLRDVYYRRKARRSFIDPSQATREIIAAGKLSPIEANITGNRLIVLEDTVVRGTTTGPRIAELRSNGAKEVHLRVGYGAISHHCPHGIDIRTGEELLAHGRSHKQMCEKIGVDSLKFNTPQDVLQVHMSFRGIEMAPDEYKMQHICMHCSDGENPLDRLYADD
jgi:amidophosphoribosyltransferase